MKKEEFERLFGGYSEYDMLSISEIRDILTTSNSERDKFLDTPIKYYEHYDLSTKENCGRVTRLINVVCIAYHEYFTDYGEVTFRDVLNFGICYLHKLRNLGKTTIEYLINIYESNGVFVKENLKKRE